MAKELTKEILEKMIREMSFDSSKKPKHMTLWTGVGGVKEYIKVMFPKGNVEELYQQVLDDPEFAKSIGIDIM
jgi:hypothetical protein